MWCEWNIDSNWFFVSNIFQSFASDRKLISFQSYWFTANRKQSCFRLIVALFAFDPFRRIYVWSTTSETYRMTFAMLSFDMVKYKPLPFIDCSRPSWYLSRSESKCFWIISAVSLLIIISVITLSMQRTFFITVCYDMNLGFIVSWIFR